MSVFGPAPVHVPFETEYNYISCHHIIDTLNWELSPLREDTWQGKRERERERERERMTLTFTRNQWNILPAIEGTGSSCIIHSVTEVVTRNTLVCE